MKILFIHPNMPGQYKHLAPAFANDPNNEVVFVTKEVVRNIPNVIKVEYKIGRDCRRDIHRYLIPVERAIFAGQEVWRVCKKIKEAGFVPDVICAHPGWGDTFFIREVYPHVPILSFLEFYYRPFGADLHFDPEEEVRPDNIARVRMKTMPHLVNLDQCDWGITPTHWQASVHPKEYMHKMSVLHDGVDTDVCVPGNLTNLKLPNGIEVQKTDEVITHIARNFEPYRGFPTFMQAAEILLRERPNARILVIGNDGVSYGAAPKGGKTYRQIWTEKVSLDTSRIHFLGLMSYQEMLNVLQISSAHIYLTMPFVLSWSMMEAMACGCAMVGSRTKPVQELIEDGKNGLLADFYKPEEVAARVIEILDHPDRMADMRREARKTIVDHYALNKVLPLHMQLITDLAERKLPPPAAKTIAAFNPLQDPSVLYNYDPLAFPLYHRA
ncbi:MAG: glycosyl transferase, group 1 [Rickettsiales bacterium]|jgi:glycosyltransferase involved in cell wall biosynthesis|nr:glycosyl transferase, group 1 [Rickettsiales bacterium]